MLLTLCTKRVLRDLDPTFEDSSPRKNPVAFNPSRFDGVGLTKTRSQHGQTQGDTTLQVFQLFIQGMFNVYI